MVDLPRCRLATWADIDRWADRLAEQVRSAQHLPDTLVGLTRGGWVPTRLLSDRLGVKRLVSVRAQHWGVTATPDGVASLSEGLSGPVAGENVLIVDDITDTGESLRLAVDHVSAARPKRVESATFLHIPHSRIVPTYYAEEIPREAWVWVVFPWNYWEDLVVLAQKAAEVQPGLPAIRATLHDRCGLDVPLADLERVAQYTRLGPA
jgi:hypoxanthine phosphoribosyltransferase